MSIIRFFRKLQIRCAATVILSLSLLLSSCTSSGEVYGSDSQNKTNQFAYYSVTDGVKASPIPQKDADALYLNAINTFTSRVMLSSLLGTENTCISPVGVMTSLLLISNAASDAALTEILDVFGNRIDKKAFNEYHATALNELKNLGTPILSAFAINNPNEKIMLTSSFLKTNADYYLAKGYAFNQTSAQVSSVLSLWLSENYASAGFKSSDIPSISGNSLTLINGISGDFKWKEPFAGKKTDVFSTTPTETSQTEYFYSVESSLITLYNAKGFVKEMTNGAKMAFILPNEGVKLSDVIKTVAFDSISDVLSKTVSDKRVLVTVPSFSCTGIYDQSSPLKKCDLDRAFSPELSPFTELCENKTPMYISSILGVSTIDLENLGTVNTETAVNYGDLTADITLDFSRPFIYVLYSANGMPLLIGNMVRP